MTLEYKEIPFEKLVDESVELLGYDTLRTSKGFWSTMMRRLFYAIFRIVQATDQHIQLSSRLGGAIVAVYEVTDGSEFISEYVETLSNPKNSVEKSFIRGAKVLSKKGFKSPQRAGNIYQFRQDSCTFKVVRIGGSKIAKVMDIKYYTRLQESSAVYGFRKPIETLGGVEPYKMDEEDESRKAEVSYRKVDCYLNERDG